MDTHEKIIEWATTLEYKRNIPIALKSICGPSTSFIWKQLMTQVKPKQEVQQKIYKNIIVRLKKKTVEDWNQVRFPIKELELWKRKHKLQQEIKEINELIDEKENIANSFSKEHKIRVLQINEITQCIKENQGKSYLLRKKSEALQNEIIEAEENLIFFRNLTPIESSEEEPDIGDTLRKCVEKIESSINEQKLEAEACPRNNTLLTPQKMSFTNIFARSELSLDDTPKYEEYKKDIANEINCLHDKDISDDIKSLLYNADTRTILNVILDDIETLKLKLYNVIIATNTATISTEQEDPIESIMTLHALQIENELHAIKHKKEIEALKRLLKDKEDKINNVFDQLEIKFSDRRELFLLQRKEAGWNALCSWIDKKMNTCKSVKDSKNELRRININIVKMQQKLVDDLRNINYKYELYKKIYKTILSYREETRILVMKLNQFTGDLQWTLPLTYDLHSKEILLFKEFPLEYNRRIGDTHLYARDVMSNISINIDTLSAETLQFLILLIECPYSAPETLLSNLWEKKIKLQTQKSLQFTVDTFNYEIYTKKDLEEKESYIDSALDKLYFLIKTSSSKLLSRDPNAIREVANLWLQMPFVDYVRPNRLHDGKNVTYYQNMYDNFYSQIKK